MKPSELRTWRQRQNLGSWKAAAHVLGLPYWRMLRLKNGEEKVPLDVELACISFECGKFSEAVKNRVISYFEVLRYTWFCERIIKVIELSHDDTRREELAITLLLGLATVLGDDFGISPAVLLKRVLSRIVVKPDNGDGGKERSGEPRLAESYFSNEHAKKHSFGHRVSSESA